MPLRRALGAAMLAGMQADDLSGFVDFAALDPATLQAVATAVRRLRIPGGRWLVRPGRALSGHFYLLEGRVRLLDGTRAAVVSAGSPRARRPIYPGPGAVQTITTCVVASLAAAAMEVARETAVVGLGAPELVTDDASWQRRFLSSPLLQRLEPGAWQRLLRAMTAHDYLAGERVIARGAPGDRCFVLCSGRAEIRRADGTVLAVLGPGMLFGEDALITGRRRNADVVMDCSGRAVSLAGDRFRCWLLEAVATPLAEPADRHLLGLAAPVTGAVATLAPERLREAARQLDPARAYAIAGGSPTQRQLAAFLLAEQGIDARPLID